MLMPLREEFVTLTRLKSKRGSNDSIKITGLRGEMESKLNCITLPFIKASQKMPRDIQKC